MAEEELACVGADVPLVPGGHPFSTLTAPFQLTVDVDENLLSGQNKSSLFTD